MSDEQKSETLKSDATKVVELDLDTYNALLERLDELEAKNSKPSKEEEEPEPEDEVDKLAKEARPQPPAERPIDLNRLSNEQLAHFIASELAKDVINPLVVKLSQLELRLEEKDLKERYQDFNDYKKDAYNILYKNSSLSLEQAYRLAKSSNPKKKSDSNEEPESDRKAELLKNLRRPATLGEKPSAAAAGEMKTSRPKDVRTAAERAIEELKLEFPVKGGNI